MLEKKLALLSNRFKANGRPLYRESRITRAAAGVVGEALKNGEIERLAFAACPLCQATKVTVVALKDRLGLPLETVICDNCGLVFSSAYFSDKGADRYYAKYCNQLKNDGRSAARMFADRTAPGAYAWKRFQWIKDALGEGFKKTGVVMEVGCNDGCNLYPFHQAGCQVYGCDFDEDRLGAGRAAGMELLSGGIESLQKLSLKADLLIFSHCLEHMPDVDLALQQAKELITPTGSIYIEVPGVKHWSRTRADKISDEWLVSGNDFLSFLQLEHNFCFELRTLKEFTKRNGLTAVKADEFIRAIFKRNDELASETPGKVNRGEETQDYLIAVERDWRRSNPVWLRILRTLLRGFR
ncbi:MAG: methyltransferase domain-containing protein [Candidatus Margulisiibacteriota bacterium]